MTNRLNGEFSTDLATRFATQMLVIDSVYWKSVGPCSDQSTVMTVENCEEHTINQLQYNLQNAQSLSQQGTLSRQHGEIDDLVISVNIF